MLSSLSVVSKSRCSKALIRNVSQKPVIIEGLREIVDRYDIILLDQFGVLHDGVKALPDVADCLKELHARKKVTVILSNSSSRADQAEKRFAQLGLPTHHSAFVTSGEISYSYIKKHFTGKKCTWFTWNSFAKDSWREGNIFDCSSVKESDFLFFHGPQIIVNSLNNFNMNQPIQYFKDGMIDPLTEEVFTIALERDLPAVCSNIDMTVMAFGSIAHMPGGLMKEYESRGGRVRSFGKPKPEFFEQAIDSGLEKFRLERGSRESLDQMLNYRRRILHVGDSLHNDIQGTVVLFFLTFCSVFIGAHEAEIDSLLITKFGVHSKCLHDSNDDRRLEFLSFQLWRF
jgi:HAD superfamily hydrolase (TIGR01450 family)